MVTACGQARGTNHATNCRAEPHPIFSTGYAREIPFTPGAGIESRHITQLAEPNKLKHRNAPRPIHRGLCERPNRVQRGIK